MRRRQVLSRLPAVVLALLVLTLWPSASSSQDRRPGAVSIELTGTIDPATAAWIDEALDDAADQRLSLAVIRLDTPGGLDSSMRRIVRSILGAPLPVVVYVSPNGARAASAGMFITLAADVAAMAPQTNIGSATPVTLGGGETDEVLGRKIRNDAIAYARALAEGHGRNADLAERMVRDAENVSAREARRRGLVEIVAEDEAALLRQLDGARVVGPKARTLATDGLRIERRDMPLEYEIRQVLVNPTVVYVLLLGGVLAIILEAFSPGVGAAGVFGAVALVLGLYGSSQLPVGAAGVILLLLAVGLLIAEAQVAGFGVFGAAGVAALVAGGLLLFDTDSDVFAVSVPIAAASGVLMGGFVLFAVSKAMAARRAPARSGAEDLIGGLASVRSTLDPDGLVYIQGALWRARLAERESTSAASAVVGSSVRIDAVHGLTLIVHEEPKESL